MKEYLTRTEFLIAHNELEQKVDNLIKIVYTGMGIVIALQFVLPKIL